MSLDGLDRVGGAEGATDGIGIGDEGQVVRALLADLDDKAGIAFGETITELFELLLRDLQVPGSFNGAPALLELGSIALAEMSFGVALKSAPMDGGSPRTLRSGSAAAPACNPFRSRCGADQLRRSRHF